MPEHDPHLHTRRDGETLVALGLFMGVLAAPVLLGTFWAGGGFPALVNFIGGALLGIVAGLFIWRGRSYLS